MFARRKILLFTFFFIGLMLLSGCKDPCCGKDYSFSAALRTQLEKSWNDSFKADGSVKEQGGSIIDKGGTETIKPGAEGNAGSFPRANFPQPGAGETLTGTYHTHPYTAADGGYKNVSFSGQDIAFLAEGKFGDVIYVMSGDCIFILVVCDKKKSKAAKSTDIVKRWEDTYDAANGTFQENVEKAVKEAIVGTGLCYYKSCKGPKDEQIPLTATLEKGDCKTCE